MINTIIQNAMECSSDFDIALACVWKELSDTQTIDIMKFARSIEKSKFNVFAVERIADYMKRFPLISAKEAFELLIKEGYSYSTIGLAPEDSEIPETIKVDTYCLPTSKEDSDEIGRSSAKEIITVLDEKLVGMLSRAAFKNKMTTQEYLKEALRKSLIDDGLLAPKDMGDGITK